MIDPLLSEIYYLKGMILRTIGGPEEVLSNTFNVRAYQCFNSSYAIHQKQENKDQQMIDIIIQNLN